MPPARLLVGGLARRSSATRASTVHDADFGTTPPPCRKKRSRTFSSACHVHLVGERREMAASAPCRPCAPNGPRPAVCSRHENGAHCRSLASIRVDSGRRRRAADHPPAISRCLIGLSARRSTVARPLQDLRPAEDPDPDCPCKCPPRTLLTSPSFHAQSISFPADRLKEVQNGIYIRCSTARRRSRPDRIRIQHAAYPTRPPLIDTRVTAATALPARQCPSPSDHRPPAHPSKRAGDGTGLPAARTTFLIRSGKSARRCRTRSPYEFRWIH